MGECHQVNLTFLVNSLNRVNWCLCNAWLITRVSIVNPMLGRRGRKPKREVQSSSLDADFQVTNYDGETVSLLCLITLLIAIGIDSPYTRFLSSFSPISKEFQEGFSISECDDRKKKVNDSVNFCLCTIQD